MLFKADFAWQKGYTNKACTSLPASWTAPSSSKAGLAPKRICDMEWRKPHYKKHGSKKLINPVSKQLFSPRKEKDKDVSLDSLMGSLFSSCSNACVFHYAAPTVMPSYPPDADVNVSCEVEVNSTSMVPPPMYKIVQQASDNSVPSLTVEEIEVLQQATRTQSNTDLWREQRVGRITSTSAHKALAKVRKINSGIDPGRIDRFVDIIMGRSQPDPMLPALKYGRTMEPAAREKYRAVLIESGHKDVVIQECGLFVHRKNVYMGASPDGLVSCSCCGTGVLEIKCPLSIAHEDPAQCVPAYLTRDQHGNVTLKHSHVYFSQVAMHLAVTDLKWCDFFVYTSRGYLLQRITDDCVATRTAEIEKACQKMFFEFVLPELLSTKCTEPIVEVEDCTASGAHEPALEGGQRLLVEQPATRVLTPQHSSTDIEPASSLSLPPRKKPKKSDCKRKVKNKSFEPKYFCDICNKQCKQVANIALAEDNSVGCDCCYKWFHWGCVGFDGTEIGDWLCANCSTGL